MATPYPAGEVVGLDQSIAYARQLALLAGEHGPAGNEGYLAHLVRSGVHGAGLATARQMQAAFATVHTAAQRHAAELGRQRGVQHAYDQTPDAGDKTFQQADQAADPTGAVMPDQTDQTTQGPPPRARDGVKDPLRVAGRLVLRDGDRFAGSGSVTGTDGQLLLGVAVDTPTGRQVHVGVPIDPEDRKAWRGGNAPARETTVDDEDGEEYTVDTRAEVTAVLDGADAARLPDLVEDVIARATEADRQFRQVAKEYERLYEQRARLEGQRYPGRGEEKISLDWRVRQDEQTQQRRRRDIERAADRLDPGDRAVYDARQRTIDAAGLDAWEPDREAEAAVVCDLSVEEYREMRDLDRIHHRQRTTAQNERLDQLKHGGGTSLRASLPPLLAAQAALVCGLTVPEYREMEALERIPKRSHIDYYNRRRRVRTDAEQARLDELDASPRGATGATLRETYNLRGQYLSMLRVHHSAKTDLADARTAQAAMAATAQPLDPAAAAELDRVTAALQVAGDRHDETAGWTSASAEIPARNGGALVVDAMQEEEGGVQYRVERRPPDADEDWSIGSTGDPFTTTAGGLRKVATLAVTLAG